MDRTWDWLDGSLTTIVMEAQKVLKGKEGLVTSHLNLDLSGVHSPGTSMGRR